jgi:hypothetical protein
MLASRSGIHFQLPQKQGEYQQKPMSLRIVYARS